MIQPTPIRTLVIGAGLMGRWHADAVQRAGSTVVAVVDANVPRAITFARRVGGGCAPVGSLDDAFARHAPQLVHICTPAGTHEALVERALAAGCHVLVEKPLAVNAAATERLLAMAAERSRLLCPVHQFLFQPGTERVVALVEGRQLGEIVHIDATVCSSGAEGAPEAERDAIALDITPHALALAFRLAPDAFDTTRWSVARPAAGELRVLGDGGAMTLAITVSMAARPTRNGATVLGTRGSAELDFFHGFSTVWGARSDRLWKVARPFIVGGRTARAAAGNLGRRLIDRETAYPGLRELVRRFHVAAAAGGPAPITPRETLAVAHARDEISRGRGSAAAVPPSAASLEALQLG